MQLTLWAATTAAVRFLLRQSISGGEVWLISVGLGLLAAMALLLAAGVVKAVREKRMLGDVATGELSDGAWVAVSGPIDSHAPLRAPFSGDSVVAYQYRIHRDEKMGRSRTQVTYFSGKALAESTIATPRGPIRLLTVPALDMAPEPLDEGKTLANADAYVSATMFADRSSAKKRTSALESEWTDDDGVFRIDQQYFVAADLSDEFRFEERQVKRGAPVCVFGIYSAERRALVPDARWGRPARIMFGTASDVMRSLSGRIVRYSLGAIVLGAVAWAGAMIYLGKVSPS